MLRSLQEFTCHDALHFLSQVNNNGHLSFGSLFGQYFPRPFPISIPLISPYWTDTDTRPSNGGTVWYRETFNQMDKDRVQNEVRAIFTEASRFTPNMVFIATWDHVGYYPGHTDKVNTR